MADLLEELRIKADNARRKNKERLHYHYHYAKSLGFSSSEAQVLQSRTKDYIDRLAAEKKTLNEEG